MGNFYLGNNNELLSIGEIGTLTFDDKFTDCITNFEIPFSDKAEISFECEVNAPLFKELVRLSSCDNANSYTLTGEMPIQVPVRYHKKKRVNKKWIKRYGYKTVYRKVEIREVHFDSCSDGYIFEGNVHRLITSNNQL